MKYCFTFMIQFHHFNGKEEKDHHMIILLMIIYSFANKYLLNVYYLPDIVLGTRNEAVSKSGKYSCLHTACILVCEDQQ